MLLDNSNYFRLHGHHQHEAFTLRDYNDAEFVGEDLDEYRNESCFGLWMLWPLDALGVDHRRQAFP